MVVIMGIGKRIIYLRERKGWSQRELARRVDLNVSVMNRIESEDRPIKDHELKRLSEVLDISTDYLLGRTDDPTPPSSLNEPSIVKESSNFFYFDKEGLNEEEIDLLEQSYKMMKERARKRAEAKKKEKDI
ncbi:helix-turn-helix domain-containing protein [Heyndrickxia sp. NPDC080065]|uniref:helix-turn-helix domain-containing protein n=1 Tax=Heyndrickxia sp. NPDC080065 TaxID=3390568 RepID=UPI003D011A58